MKKHALAIMLAMGGPKSRNASGSGAASDSIASPDQGGDAMAPGGSSMDDGDEAPQSTESGGDGDDDGDDYTVPLPAGFKAPGGDGDGTPFTTTIQCTIMDDPNNEGQKLLKIAKIGDMPVDGSSETEEQPDENVGEQEEDQTDASGGGDQGEDQPSPMLQKETAKYAKKSKDEKAARNVFQPGR